jgi:N-acetylmuramoyl-L-alanine amidase
MIFITFSCLTTNGNCWENPADGNRGPVKTVIVLDAGHGGYDTGARTAGDISEKNVNMTFVKILARKLRNHHRVHLTRTDDYWVDLADRAALANHLNADLFLSIHTNASTLKTPNGIMLSHLENADVLQRPSGASVGGMRPWDALGSKHTEKSQYFAGLLKDAFKAFDSSLHVHIQGIPLFVLQGADQPALMIEIGYLTNPSDLKILQNDEKLHQYANVISLTVDAFLQKAPIDND